MGSHAKGKRTWLAVLAAFVLIAHSLVAGFVDGAMAEPRLLDVFGNPICSTHGSGDGSPGQPANHSHLPDCCLAGCSLAGSHALAAAAQPFLIVRGRLQKEHGTINIIARDFAAVPYPDDLLPPKARNFF